MRLLSMPSYSKNLRMMPRLFLPLLKDRFFEGETYVYVCQNRVCLPPVESVKEAMEQMENWEN